MSASCVVCNTEIPAKGGRKYCRECRDIFLNMKRRATSAVGAAIHFNKLIPAKLCDCVDCGEPAKHYDHRNYSKPLEVDPVCVPCNRKRGIALDVIPSIREARGI